jgi:hypothetical protein
MNRAKARESVRGVIGSTIRLDLIKCEAGPMNAVVTSLLIAIQSLLDVSESQDEEIDELREQIGKS